MANLLKTIAGGARNLLNNPIVQGAGFAATFGANPLVGLLIGAGIQGGRERRQLEMDELRERVGAMRDSRLATERVSDLLGRRGSTQGPRRNIGLMDLEGGVENISIPGYRTAGPDTPQAQAEIASLVPRMNPGAFAETLLGQMFPDPVDAASPIGKLLQDRDLLEQQGNVRGMEAIDQQIALLGNDPEKLRGFRNDLRDASRDFLVLQQGFDVTMQGFTDGFNGNEAGDIAGIFGYMKLLDPGSRVTQGEIATTENAGNVPQRVMAAYNRLVLGEGSLEAGMRREFMEASRNLFMNARKRQQAVIDDARDFASRNNLKPGDVIPSYLVPRPEESLLQVPGKRPGAVEILGAEVPGAGGPLFLRPTESLFDVLGLNPDGGGR